MTKPEFIIWNQAYQRSLSRRLVAITASLLFWAGINAPIFRHFLFADDPVWLMIVWLILFLVVLAAHVPVALRLHQGLQRSYSVKCPQCSQELIGPLALRVIKTENCGRCGGQVFTNAAEED
jgi:hypothetical protein